MTHASVCLCVRRSCSCDRVNRLLREQLDDAKTANQSLAAELRDATTANQSLAAELRDATTANQSLAVELHDATTANQSLAAELSVVKQQFRDEEAEWTREQQVYMDCT